MIELYNRIATYEGSFFYDMGDGRVIKTTAAGWVIDSSPPIFFRRYDHQQPQVEPRKGGTLDRIFSYMNVVNDQDQLLLEVCIVSLFIPDISHPLINTQGGQGTGKTKAASTIKKIADPSKVDVFIPPHDRRELVQTLYHHYFCVFDNLSNIPDWFSDILSIAVTGGGQSKRKLYSDDEDVIYNYKRCICLTGINMCIEKSDLLDRSILIQFDRIPPEKRKEEAELIRQFENEKPLILGAIFDALSKAMKIYPSIKIEFLPRMADFCRWGCAIAVALGHEAEDFLNAYKVNIQKQHQEVINVNTLAQAIITFMKDKKVWTGLVGDLYKKLKKLADPSNEDSTFPAYSNKLRAHIERINTNLIEYGIKVSIANSRGDKGTPVTIRKKAADNINKLRHVQEIENSTFTAPEDHEDKIPDLHPDLQDINKRIH